MPIHFRCPHCNQLMGIARRKSGTLIHCPTCTKELVVPRGGEAAVPEKVPEPPRPNSLLEKLDVDAILNAPATGKAEKVVHAPEPEKPALRLASPPPPLPRPAAPKARVGELLAKDNGVDPDLPSLALGPRRRGLFLSTPWIVLLCLIDVVLLAIAFFLGWLAGRQM